MSLITTQVFKNGEQDPIYGEQPEINLINSKGICPGLCGTTRGNYRMYEQKEYIDIEEADITLSCIGKKSAPKHINNIIYNVLLIFPWL